MLQERLKELRKEKGITQKDIAIYFRIDQSTYAGYESGKSTPSPEKVIALADYFGVTTDYLLGRSDIRHPGEVAAASSDLPYDELPPEALKELEEYKKFLRMKYGKDRK